MVPTATCKGNIGIGKALNGIGKQATNGTFTCLTSTVGTTPMDWHKGCISNFQIVVLCLISQFVELKDGAVPNTILLFQRAELPSHC
jgi:hypothetical protein